MGLRPVWITERDNQTSKRFCVAVEPVRSQQAQESGCCLGSGLSPSTHWGLSSLSQRMETGYLPLMVCQAKGQLLREAGCGGRAFPPPASVTGFSGSANCGIWGLASHVICSQPSLRANGPCRVTVFSLEQLWVEGTSRHGSRAGCAPTGHAQRGQPHVSRS